MSNHAKRYTKQFKEDAVAYARDHSDLSVNALANNLGIAPSTLGKWLKKADEGTAMGLRIRRRHSVDTGGGRWDGNSRIR